MQVRQKFFRRCSILLCCLLFCLVSLGASFSVVSAAEAPFLTWAAVQRFWNKSATGSLHIRQARPNNNGYYVVFGQGTSLTAKLDDERVIELILRYDEDSGFGGKVFLRAVERLLELGTYGWDDSERLKAERVFQPLVSQRLYFKGETAHFSRYRNSENVWIFTLNYIIK